MSTTEASNNDTFLDFSTRESRRRTFRKLVILALGCVLTSWVAFYTAPVASKVQAMCDAEIESIPEWRFWTGMAASIGLIACGLYGLYRLWMFKADGAGYVAFATFFPMFMWVPLTVAFSPFGAYVDEITNVVLGMLLFASWSMPDVFDSATEATPVVAPESLSQSESAAS
jgi:hypothetical protein